MDGYLGSFEVTEIAGTPFAGYGPIDWAMHFIERYGQIDGSHHKAWVLDQVARILKGTPITVYERLWENEAGDVVHRKFDALTVDEPSAAYTAWVTDMLGAYDEVGDEYEYGYDEGCAP